MNNKNTFSLLSVLMLLLAIPSSFMPYSYFEILRWVVATTGLYNAHQAYKNKEEGWVFAMVALAILFNPINSFRFTKDTWQLFDLIGSASLIGFIIKNK